MPKKPTGKPTLRKLPAPRKAATAPADILSISSGKWGPEFDGGRADPERAHALGAFIESLMVVDETNDQDILAMLDRHLLGIGVNAVDEQMRKVIREARSYIANLHVTIGREAAESLTTTKRLRLIELLERLRKKDTLEPKPPPHDFLPCHEDKLTLLERVWVALYAIDPCLLGKRTEASDRTIESIVANIQGDPRATLPFAAASLSCALGMFGDEARTPRAARRFYDSALKKR